MWTKWLEEKERCLKFCQRANFGKLILWDMGAKALFYWYVTLSESTERDINLDTSTLMFSIFFNGLAIWPVNPAEHYLTVTANKITAN